MNEQTVTPQPENTPRKNTNTRNTLSIKIGLIALLILLCFIPMGMIRNLIEEREETADKAVNEVQQKWSGSQMIIGPVLTIPYLYLNEKGETKNGHINYLPEQLDITGDIKTEELKRGLYEIIVYNSTLEIKGKFIAKDLLEQKLPHVNTWPGIATLNLGIQDLRGISDQITLEWNGEKQNFNPGVSPFCVVTSGVSVNVNTDLLQSPDGFIHFSIKLKLKGSESMQFAPLGRTTDIKLTSNCVTPSFTGAFLPSEREITSTGFTGEWKVLELNRNYPQVLTGNQLFTTYRHDDIEYIPESVDSKYVSAIIAQSAFGVNLLFPVDQYQKSMRSAKYAFLIIILTFVVCFFVEIIQKKNIHPFQYLLVGLALCLFYTLLIATSEHTSFTLAYILSAGMTTSLITLYMMGVLKIKKTALTIGGLLVCLYTYIFFLIQLETYALLAGSIGLFIILAIIMYFSQKINWYNH